MMNNQSAQTELAGLAEFYADDILAIANTAIYANYAEQQRLNSLAASSRKFAQRDAECI